MSPGLALALVLSATSVPGGTLSGTVTWTAAGSPYQLAGTLWISPSAHLTLEAGTVVIPLSPDVRFTSYGTLVVNGTAAAPVVIGDATHEFTDLYLDGPTSTLRHLKLVNTSSGLVTYSGVVSGADLEIQNESSRYSGTCLRSEGGTSTFTRVKARCHGDGVHLNAGELSISDSVLDHDDDGVWVDSDATVHVDHTLVRGGYRGYVSYGRGDFTHNTVVDASKWSIDLRATANVLIRDNVLVVSSASDTNVAGDSSATVTFDHNLVWGSTGPRPVYGVGGSDVGRDANASDDPRFVSATDFHLTAASPARGAGSSGSDLGAFAYSTATGSSPASITISPSGAAVAAGGALALTATVRDSAGNPLASAPVTWSISSGLGSILGGALTAPCTPGIVTVRASSGAVSSTATVTVTAGPASRLAISPMSPTLAAGGQLTFTAAALDTCGNGVPVPPLSWSASAAAGTMTGATFRAGTTPGTFAAAVAVSGGSLSASTAVTVTGGGSSGQVASLQVTPSAVVARPGQAVQLAVAARDAAGNPVVATPMFQMILPAAGSVTQAGGFTTATAAGSYAGAVQVSAGAVSTSVDVVIIAGPAQRIAVSPGAVTLAPTGVIQLAAAVVDAQGNALPDAVTFSMASSAAGAVTTSGLFTAGATEGTYPAAVQARAAGLTAAVDVTVTPDALTRLQVLPGTVAVRASDVVTFTVVAHDAHGGVVSVNPAWAVVRGGGTISSGGVFKAGERAARFDYTVQAAARGLTAAASVEVTAGPVAALRVDPPWPTVPANDALRFQATAFDAFGNEAPAEVRWSADALLGDINGVTGVLSVGPYDGNFADAVWATDTVSGVSASASVVVVGGKPLEPPPQKNQSTSQQFTSTGCGCGVARGLPPLLALLALLALRRAARARRHLTGERARARP